MYYLAYSMSRLGTKVKKVCRQMETKALRSLPVRVQVLCRRKAKVAAVRHVPP